MAGLTPMQSYALYRVREEYLLWQGVWQRLVRSTGLACTAGLGSSFLLQGDRQSAWEALHPHLSLLEHQGDPKPLCNAIKAGLGIFSQWESRCAFLAPNSAQMIKWLQELFKKSTSSQCCQKGSIRCCFWPISNWWSQQHQQRNNSQELQSVTLCHSSPQKCSFQKSIQLHITFYCNQHHSTRKTPSIRNVFCPRNCIPFTREVINHPSSSHHCTRWL